MMEGPFSLSRRRFIAWVGAGAAAGAGGWAGLAATGDGDAVGRAADLLFSGAHRGPEREVRTLHFALGRAEEFVTGLHLCVGGTRADLVPHDDRSRRRLAIRNPVAARTDLSQFTHSAPQINVPTTRPLEVILYGTDLDTGQEVIVGGVLLHPTWAMRRVVLAADSLGILHDQYAQHRMVHALGISAEDAPATPREALALEDLVDQATSIAQKMVFKHPGIINMDPVSAGITQQLVSGTPLLDGLATAVRTLLDNVGTYGQLLPQRSATGGQQTMESGGQQVPVSSFQPFMLDGTEYKSQQIPTDWTSALRQTTAQTISAVINQVQDTLTLENKSWVLATGTAPTTQPVTPPDPPPPGTTTTTALPGPEVTTTTAAVTTTTAPPPPPAPRFSIDSTWHNGTMMQIQGVTTTTVPGTGGQTFTVPVITVRVFNNNEKVFDLFGQYFDSDQKQLPGLEGSQSATDLAEPFGSTLYAAPTILGIPLFDQNWVDYVVTFPPSATEARLMLATMGGLSGWQQNLLDTSSNQLYPDAVFPPECKNAVIWTTVLNLAIPTLMLAMDVVAFASVLKGVFTIAEDADRAALSEEVSTYFRLVKGAAGMEGIASLFDGTMSAQDFGGPNKPSMVTVMLELGIGLIGLLSIFALAPILAAILTAAAVEEPAKAIPIVGEVLMAISAAADAAVLGQTIGEVANDTWVTTRSLTGVYDATVTVQPDFRSTTFPLGATKWTLTPHLSKTDSLTAIEDATFQQSGPVSGNLTIPVPNVRFGGQIRYSIAMVDENGWTVGAGSTDWLDNFDPTNLPVPTFRITELAPPVSAGSSFNRRWTSQFDSTASAYSWSTAATVPGTIVDQQTCDAPEDICRAGSIVVGTATGFLGYTYQTTQGWFVRQLSFAGPPTNEQPGTAGRGIATPFAAEPLLLYDSISHDPAQGQNFLLEPIAGANAYHVRQLDLTAADLGLDSTTSWGIFLDTIHGVVMHPAGFLMGFNTDSGKLHVLQLPDAGMDETIAPSATMHAGTGNATGERPGLTQRPVSVAVGLSGIVLVLEQAANRIQAFDVRGNPTKYFFGKTSYYLPLVAQDTYLGMSVDGTGYIYTLSYSDDGSDPSQYGVDVYDATGAHIFRGSGVNGANFVVDYWRNVYTQNFAAVQQTSGGTYITPQGVAEPSTTVWIPDTPNTGGPG